jgi:hypothetical protein
VVVLRPETGADKFWATISYGWETAEFYQKWAGASAWDRDLWQGPYLDPLAAQTRFSDVLLEVFKALLQPPDYVERLKYHYQLFRDAVEKDPPSSNSQRQPSVVTESRRRRDRNRPRHGWK